MRRGRWYTMIAATLFATGCGAAAGSGEGRSEVLFADNCGVCHGEAGQGNPEIEAPAIAGLPGWYVDAQLSKFRMGYRGAHADDAAGLRMRPMSRSLSEEDLSAVAGYVAGMVTVEPDRSMSGDAESGKKLYATCAACHGPKGGGMEQLHAPPIRQLDDWYFAAQIHKFKQGMRGADPGDVTGNQMRPMANNLPDEQAVADVIAYLSSLDG